MKRHHFSSFDHQNIERGRGYCKLRPALTQALKLRVKSAVKCSGEARRQPDVGPAGP